MTNLNVNEKVMKFKDLCNKSYEVDFNDDDLVIDIKKKVSKEIMRNYKNIVLMFKNEILFDDKLINDYKIESNRFVLWLDGEDCMRYSRGESDSIKCITIIDSYNDFEYFVNMNKYLTVGMMKSIFAGKYGFNSEQFYLEFNGNNLSINGNATLEQCGLRNGCRIRVIHTNKVRIAYKYLGESREITIYNLSMFSTVGRLEQICAEKTGFDYDEISLQFNGKCLSGEDATLESCGLSDGCTVHLVTGNFISLYISYNDKYYPFRVNEFCTVGKLRRLVKEKMWPGMESSIFIFNGSGMRDDHRLNDYGMCDGDRIVVTYYVCGAGGILYNASMIPLSDQYDSFEIENANCLDDLITEISTKCRIRGSLINLYSDADKINQIRNNQELQDLYQTNLHHLQTTNTIYYEIIPELDEFEKIGKLGSGLFGKVFKCRNKNTNKIFALKKFELKKFSLSLDLREREDFQREVDCYLKLRSHIRIVKYENHFIDENNSYILMEYMDRGSLGSYVKHNDPLSEHKIAKYARQILEGLEYLHCNRILHRDLKGDNILLNEKDDLKLCDFGLAKTLTDISSGGFLNGVVQSNVGTRNWMSPEIINGEPCGSPSDIWSFGATMVEIITRKYPHQGLADGKMVLNILAGQVKFDYPANSSNDIKSFINSCLKRNPIERASIKDLYRSSFLKSNSN